MVPKVNIRYGPQLGMGAMASGGYGSFLFGRVWPAAGVVTVVTRRGDPGPVARDGGRSPRGRGGGAFHWSDGHRVGAWTVASHVRSRGGKSVWLSIMPPTPRLFFCSGRGGVRWSRTPYLPQDVPRKFCAEFLARACVTCLLHEARLAFSSVVRRFRRTRRKKADNCPKKLQAVRKPPAKVPTRR